MKSIIAYLTGVILTSFYLFPFEFRFLPGLNTKMAMAAVAGCVLAYRFMAIREVDVAKWFLSLFIGAGLVSVSTFMSVVYNNTSDYTYVTYIVSMLVWLGGAYTLVCYYKLCHKYTSVQLITSYAIFACAVQCVIAILISRFPSFYDFCNSFCLGLDDVKRMSDGRLFGIGCAFDVAGMRFAAILVMLGFVFPSLLADYSEKKTLVILYSFSFVLMSVIGCMIARTTTVGIVISLVYVIMQSRISRAEIDRRTANIWSWIGATVFVSVVVCTALYKYDPQFKDDLRFAFEGFFSLAEKGRWEVHSNDILKSMYRWPEETKTWIIGDGYFFNTSIDPNYIGKEYSEFYMATDVGYIRFIFYSGLIGMAAFILFFLIACRACIQKHSDYSVMLFLLLLVQFIVWTKVASDIFLLFALCLVTDGALNDDETDEEKAVMA